MARNRRGFRLFKLWPAAARRRRWWRSYRRQNTALQLALGIVLAALLSISVNWLYQVMRKPSELFFPVSGTLFKSAPETWRAYEPIFTKYSTPIMTRDLLAALAQVEGSGNPIVRTYWRWAWTAHPFGLYRPASSAVGMYQITDGTFAEAKRYCIRNHAVIDDGPWNDWQSCWFNALYTRTIPSNAVELTAAYLDRGVANILARHHLSSASIEHKQMLAAIIHLCGAGAGDDYARRGFKLIEGQRCGDHETRVYLSRE